MLYHNLLDCGRKLTVCGTSVLPAESIIHPRNRVLRKKLGFNTSVLLVEGIIPTGKMARSQFLYRCRSSGARFLWDSGFLYTCGISIAVTIRSIDPRWG